MILRALTLVTGLTAGAGLSQFPEFSQQYLQRLGGAVDELSRQIDRAEAEARAEGETLEQWLAGLSAEGPRAQTQAEAIRSDIARHAALSADLAALRGAGPFSRARLAGHLGDPGIAQAAWADYRPAIPATFEGALFAALGFVLGGGLISAAVAFLRGLWDMVPGMRRAR